MKKIIKYINKILNKEILPGSLDIWFYRIIILTPGILGFILLLAYL